MADKNIGKDLFFSQVKRGYDSFRAVINNHPDNFFYDIVLAHETYCSGLAGLYASEKCESPYKILDIVEYPIFSERSSVSIREFGLSSKTSDILTTNYAFNLANLYDLCISSSQGQINIYKSGGVTSDFHLIRNCRSCSQLENNFDLRKMFNLAFDDIILLYPNRVYANSGIELAISTLSALDKRFKIIVLGEIVPELENDIHNLLEIHSVKDRFFVTGMLDPAFVIPATMTSDISLILLEPTIDNHKFSLPNRVFDAIAGGNPIVSIANTEIGDFVSQYSIGQNITEISPSALREAILIVIKKMEYFKRTLKLASHIFDWEHEVNGLLTNILINRPNATDCLIIANKDIRRNDRIKRIGTSLVNVGLNVDIISPRKPLDSILVQNAKYYYWKE